MREKTRIPFSVLLYVLFLHFHLENLYIVTLEWNALTCSTYEPQVLPASLQVFSCQGCKPMQDQQTALLH